MYYLYECLVLKQHCHSFHNYVCLGFWLTVFSAYSALIKLKAIGQLYLLYGKIVSCTRLVTWHGSSDFDLIFMVHWLMFIFLG